VTPEALAKVLAQYIGAQRGQQIRLDDIRAHATRTDPTLLADPTARTRLNDALLCLASDGVITLPRSPKAYDRRVHPPLPTWVAKPPKIRTDAPAPTVRVWPHALEPAAALASRADELALLGKIADWMRDSHDDEPAPVEERSLEILGDEKELGTLTASRLFTSGALTLDLLRCFRTPLPFASQHIPGSGPTTLLVAENNATYNSLVTVARAQAEESRADLHIAWGSGRQFPVSIDSVNLLTPAPTALYYFGDLDLAGLQIANDAAHAAQRLGLPPLRPAVALYAKALELGTPQPDKSNPGNMNIYDPLLAWLPEDLHEATDGLLRQGLRIPQETVNRQVLRSSPSLLATRNESG
jgi:hypothetical protein